MPGGSTNNILKGQEMIEVVHTPTGSYFCPSTSKLMLSHLKRNGGYSLDKLQMFFGLTEVHYGKRTGLFVDIGANIGTTIIPAMRHPNITSGLAVEPAPLVFACLCGSIALSQLNGKVQTVQAAVTSSNTGTATLALNAENCGDNRVAAPVNADTADWETVDVPAVQLDTLVTDEPAYVWIDAQGHEAHIMKDSQWVEQRIPFFVEFFPPHLDQPQTFLRTVELNYTHFIDVKTPNQIRPSSDIRKLFAEMMSQTDRCPDIHTDLFLI